MTDEAKRLYTRAIECAALAIHDFSIDVDPIANVIAATFCEGVTDVVKALEDRVEWIEDYGCRDEDEACGECRPCLRARADIQQDRAMDAADRGRL